MNAVEVIFVLNSRGALTVEVDMIAYVCQVQIKKTLTKGKSLKIFKMFLNILKGYEGNGYDCERISEPHHQPFQPTPAPCRDCSENGHCSEGMP